MNVSSPKQFFVVEHDQNNSSRRFISWLLVLWSLLLIIYLMYDVYRTDVYMSKVKNEFSEATDIYTKTIDNSNFIIKQFEHRVIKLENTLANSYVLLKNKTLKLEKGSDVSILKKEHEQLLTGTDLVYRHMHDRLNLNEKKIENFESTLNNILDKVSNPRYEESNHDIDLSFVIGMEQIQKQNSTPKQEEKSTPKLDENHDSTPKSEQKHDSNPKQDQKQNTKQKKEQKKNHTHEDDHKKENMMHIPLHLLSMGVNMDLEHNQDTSNSDYDHMDNQDIDSLIDFANDFVRNNQSERKCL